MINSVQIQKITLPKLFIFDSIKIYAQFITTTLNIANLTFQPQQCLHQRVVILNVTMKLPSSRNRFILGVQVCVINLHIPTVQIPVDLCELGQQKRIQFIFLTEMGKVTVDMNLVEQVYLSQDEGANSSEEQFEGKVEFTPRKIEASHSVILSKNDHENTSAVKSHVYQSAIQDERKNGNVKGSIVRQKIEKSEEKGSFQIKHQQIQTPKSNIYENPKPQRSRPKFQKIPPNKKQKN